MTRDSKMWFHHILVIISEFWILLKLFHFFLLSGHISQSYFLLPSDMRGNLRPILQPETWIPAASFGSCVGVAALGVSTTGGTEDIICVVTIIRASCVESRARGKILESGNLVGEATDSQHL